MSDCAGFLLLDTRSLNPDAHYLFYTIDFLTKLKIVFIRLSQPGMPGPASQPLVYSQALHGVIYLNEGAKGKWTSVSSY